MMQTTISATVIAAVLLTMLAGALIPLTLFLVLKLRYKCKGIPFLAGALTMFLSAMVLEQILHTIVLLSPAGAVIQGNIWLYGLYGALCAAAFEEVGRYITMRHILKNHHGDKKTAIMYGAGHGGFECAYLLIFGMLSNLIMMLMINSGTIDQVLGTLSGDALEQNLAAIETLKTISAGFFALSIYERIIAVTAQIVMSIFMWQAAAKGKKLYFPVAFLMHFLLDFCVVIVNNYLGAVAAECTITVLSILALLAAVKLYRKE